jgi:cobyrinic acid a,c-diamide synthase
LEAAGAELVFLNALSGRFTRDLNALYIGGGFPETQAPFLSQNEGFRKDLARAIEAGLPVYAECGGLMYLGKTLVYRGDAYPMVGVFPFTFGLEQRPQGHGYTRIKVVEQTYFPVGTALGHEFHYSRVSRVLEGLKVAFQMTKGRGLRLPDGVLYTYRYLYHLHALGAGMAGG